MGSVAGVIGGRGIISLDYERVMYGGMRTFYNGREDRVVADNVRTTFKASNEIRIGGEFKVTPSFSVRAGYSYKTSPVEENLAQDPTAELRCRIPWTIKLNAIRRCWIPV